MTKLNLSMAFHLNDAPYLKSSEIEKITRVFCTQVLTLMDEVGLTKVSIYFSGRFLEALSKVNNSILGAILEKTKAGQIQWLGGGYFDPIFPLIPRKTQDLHIKKHLALLEQTLNVRPRGFVLPSYVWESECIDLLYRHGFEYTCLKQYQLQDSLWRYGTDKGFWTVEDRGKVLKVLSSSHNLSKHFVDGQYKKFIGQLNEISEHTSFTQLDLPFIRRNRGHFHEEWFDRLKKLLKRMKQDSLEVSFETLDSQVDQQISGGTIYLQPSIGKSLGLKEHQTSCRDLLILQPECNYIHKKMIYIHKAIDSVENLKIRNDFYDMLLPAQSLYYYRNSAKTGGIRYVEDRQEIHSKLIDIEDRLRKLSGVRGLQVEVTDFFGNGAKEVLFANDQIAVIVEPKRGGVLRSLDYRPARHNLINSYLQSERSEGKGPIYQVFPMVGLRDVLCSKEDADLVHIPDWIHNESHILSQPMDFQIKPREDSSQLLLSGEQRIKFNQVEHIMQMDKVFTFKGKGSEFLWTQQLKNGSFREFDGYYGSLFNLSSSGIDVTACSLSVQGARVDIKNNHLIEDVSKLIWKDKSKGISLHWEFHKPCKLFVRPILDFGMGNEFESQFQGIQLLPLWDCKLLGQEKISLMSKIICRKAGFLFG